MKVLIHDTVTGLYLAEGDRWVKGITEAQDFKHAPDALLHAGALGLTNVELTYAFSNQKDNLSVPLVDSGMSRLQQDIYKR